MEPNLMVPGWSYWLGLIALGVVYLAGLLGTLWVLGVSLRRAQEQNMELQKTCMALSKDTDAAQYARSAKLAEEEVAVRQAEADGHAKLAGHRPRMVGQ